MRAHREPLQITPRGFVAALVVVALISAGSLSAGQAQSQQQPPPQQPSKQQPAKQPPINLSQPPPPPPQPASGTGQRPVIRAAAELVLIDVQVTDRSGKPIKGLKPEQFTLTEDNQQQKIDSFDYYDVEAVEVAAAADQRPIVVQLGAVAQPEAVRQAVRDRRMIVLFFDLSSMQPDEILRSGKAAVKFIAEQMTPADLVAIVTFGNTLKVAAPFTNDRAFLVRAVTRLRPGLESLAAVAPGDTTAADAVTEDTGDAFTADETEFNIFNTDRKLAALEGLAALLRDIPGKKSVIQFSGGITQTGQENRSQLRATTDAANRANTSFYTVDSRGLSAAPPGGDALSGGQSGTAMFSGQSVFRQAGARQDSLETLSTLASDTGGRSFTDIGDFNEVFSKVQEDASGYYLLGYYSKNSKRDGRWRAVRVKLNLPGARIRAREGYYAPKDYGLFTAEDRERQLEEAMRAETPRVELALALETAQFRLDDLDVFVPIAAKLASSALEWAEKRGRREAEFDFAAEVREETTGRSVGALRDTVRVKLDPERFQQVQQRAIVYQGGVILGPGRYRIKFLARENETGRVGTFEQEMTIPLPVKDSLQLSTILLSSQLEAVRKSSEVETKALAEDVRMKKSPLEVGGERIIPSVTRVFTTQQRLYVFFQAYLPDHYKDQPLRAGLVFFRDGQKQFETPMLEPADVDAKARIASFRVTLPLEKVAPGRYSVQAIVIEPGGEMAAFARSYFALRPPPQPKAASASSPGQ